MVPGPNDRAARQVLAATATAVLPLACIALALRLIRHAFPSATETAGTDAQEEQRCP